VNSSGCWFTKTILVDTSDDHHPVADFGAARDLIIQYLGFFLGMKRIPVSRLAM